MADEKFYLVDGREVAVTPHMNVRCDGGNGPLGHPIEYMTLQNGPVICKYCDRRFVLAGTDEAAEVEAEGEREAA